MSEPAAGRGQALYETAKRLIPGGTQLLSKRPEMFLPDQWPSYFARAAGARVWDLDGNQYLDMTHNSVGATVLGAADPDVDAAVIRAIGQGAMSTLNCPEEVELAELLLDLHPWAQMVRYTRTGGEAMAVAVRIARAATGRDRVAFCGYHGWADWYLATNLEDPNRLSGHLLTGLPAAGVPKGLLNTALPFRYNHLDEVAAIVARHGRELAAIVLESTRGQVPEPGFFAGIRRLADECGAVVIIDEISAGFRLCTGGAHLVLGIDADLAVIAKAMSNGYPMAAVMGKAAVMEAAQTSFISSSYWTERIGPVAALATIRKHRDCAVADHLQALGATVQKGWRDAAAAAGLPITIGGMTPMSNFSLPGDDGKACQTLFTQIMLDRGFLAGAAFYATYAHQPADIAAYLEAVGDVFAAVAAARAAGTVTAQLRGPVAHSGFQRLT